MEVKRILFPTDFSEPTENALPFLLNLAKKTNSEVVFFNAFAIPEMITDLPYDAIEKEVEALEVNSSRQLVDLMDRVREYEPDVRLNILSRAGSFSTELKNVIEEYDIDLVLMATKGVDGIVPGIFGTRAARVIEKARCPVIVIPQQTALLTVKKIAFASEYHEDDIDTIKFLAHLAAYFEATLTIVNVYSENLIMERLKTNEFQSLVEESVVSPGLKFKYVKGEDVFQALRDYIEENGIDLLAMTTRNKGLFTRLFEGSTTRKMVSHGNAPIMAFHSVE